MQPPESQRVCTLSVNDTDSVLERARRAKDHRPMQFILAESKVD
jgi:hypothetical protein